MAVPPTERDQAKPPSSWFENILAAVDGSERAERAVEVAIGEAATFGAKLTFLHILEVPVSPFYPEKEVQLDVSRREEEKATTTKGEKMAARAVSLAEARGVKATQQIIRHTGRSTAEGIVEYATAHGVDLVVVGASGLTGIKGLLLGDVASGVVGSAKCSVIVAR
jgi:nucleotide-binding universal stress UspA family protein